MYFSTDHQHSHDSTEQLTDTSTALMNT